MHLYGYFRSSASYRVRIALNLKQLDYDTTSIHLNRNGGEQFGAAFRAINPAALVPALGAPGSEQAALTQSLAIIEYLEELHPEPPLLPRSPADRAFVRSIALAIACDVHPLNNLRVLKYLTQTLGAGEDAKTAWYRHWVATGLAVLETMLAQDGRSGDFCYGDAPTLADCCLVPQIANAQRFECDLSRVPTLMRIHANCQRLDAFQRAAPGAQPDAE
ncbi:maleylacetoacetate isomerase [Massilia putida]|uniref:maleylacetoacetate isomerase n=1 Tax=Massilia putida TaxID=1141883 RepID=UPI0009516E7E|nr:maleylacetoacetate isomerase [Massilia putida]